MRFERRRRLKEAFAEQVAAGERCDVARGALTIARIAYPDLDPAPSLAALDQLADAAQRRLAAAPDTPPTETLTRVVFEEHGFRGNTDDYYDPRNSFLNDVLVRRTGIP